jgi:hypothetical protein
MEKAKQHGYSFEINGWTYISIWGEPRERGFSYGFFSAKEFKNIQQMLAFNVLENNGHPWSYFVDLCKTDFVEDIRRRFPEFMEEMEGIAEGMIAAGVDTSIDEIVAYNNYITIVDCWYPNSTHSFKMGPSTGKEGGGRKPAADRCSAFIATGDYTTDGKIVVAHNSFVEFIDGQYYKVILDLKPTNGHRFIMQTQAGSIWSGTDFFVTDCGIIGTETTIGGFIAYEKNDPIACRIRKAMQYGNTMDEYVEILLDGNSGDYANAWLFGDIRSNEIMRFELGLKFWDIKKTTNGYFYGANFPFSPEIRNFECANTGFRDIRRHQGSRQVRIPDLMEEHKGKINLEVAKVIIGDHYDVYLHKENPCSRTVCSHYELDGREYMSDPSRPKPFAPRGVVDGAVADAECIKNMSIVMKYGSSCNLPFHSKEFCNEHRQWRDLEPFLMDRPIQPWTVFSCGMKEGDSPSIPRATLHRSPHTPHTSPTPHSFTGSLPTTTPRNSRRRTRVLRKTKKRKPSKK